MQLPDSAIGPTDVIAYRECPRRMSYGMRRHVGVGVQDKGLMPEAAQHGAVWAREYGSAIHAGISALEEGVGVGRAVQEAWNQHGDALNPDDIDLLVSDLEIYVARDFPNTRTVLNEGEVRVFLMEYRGTRIYFRTRVDRLYERLDAPGTFIHVDYKSSRHAKTEADVRDDLQLWQSNWALHEFYPEIENLVQIYDQLRFGQIPTRKTADARRKIKEFLVAQVTAILENEDVQEDGLLPPKKNIWCAYCPIMESCPIIPQLSSFARFEIAALAPAVKVGRKTVVEVDEQLVAKYMYEYEEAVDAAKILERFVDAVKSVLKEMPGQEREQLGYHLTERSATLFSTEAHEALHRELGDRYYEIVKITKSQLEAHLADEPETLAWAMALGDKTVGATLLVKN